MRLSTQRIRTTHVGSLPRNEAVIDLLVRMEERGLLDCSEFDKAVHRGVLEIVQRQTAIGIDSISDGETSKISYATYVKDRLTGFGETSAAPKVHRDMRDFPRLRQTMALLTGSQKFRRPACTGPIAMKDREPLRKDIQNFEDRGGARRSERGIHECRFAGNCRLVPAERILPEARSICGGDRRSPARGI